MGDGRRFRPVGGGLLVRHRQVFGQLGDEDIEHPALLEQVERAGRRAASQEAVELLENPGRRAFQDFVVIVEDGLPGGRLDVEIEPCANLMARIIRTGSSRKRMSGSPMVRIVRAFKSSRPAT
jgi:hypothetical protein